MYKIQAPFEPLILSEKKEPVWETVPHFRRTRMKTETGESSVAIFKYIRPSNQGICSMGETFEYCDDCSRALACHSEYHLESGWWEHSIPTPAVCQIRAELRIRNPSCALPVQWTENQPHSSSQEYLKAFLNLIRQVPLTFSFLNYTLNRPYEMGKNKVKSADE
ncbi:hypothetical protein K432DRAFT_440485 [Lepidopterella palustris CBS 459.81]|uniref:Uncharacterized protein n=1 Tax=Lepidopterella palustris CBS 459.81 TaxID=1314670 RepID=A0A8E2EHU9_9PEZI|nr:hypothetical protein K432DRAFT_440485 [Lepidopterella palustris CBS 459.81]